jgi:hypothetical protein
VLDWGQTQAQAGGVTDDSIIRYKSRPIGVGKRYHPGRSSPARASLKATLVKERGVVRCEQSGEKNILCLTCGELLELQRVNIIQLTMEIINVGRISEQNGIGAQGDPIVTFLENVVRRRMCNATRDHLTVSISLMPNRGWLKGAASKKRGDIAG